MSAQRRSGVRVAVLGAGALGSFFGGMMAAGVVDVTLIDLDVAHLKANHASRTGT